METISKTSGDKFDMAEVVQTFHSLSVEEHKALVFISGMYNITILNWSTTPLYHLISSYIYCDILMLTQVVQEKLKLKTSLK